MKRAVVGVVAALVLAAGNAVSAVAQADASTKEGSTAEPQGLSLVVCYYLRWMC